MGRPGDKDGTVRISGGSDARRRAGQAQAIDREIEQAIEISKTINDGSAPPANSANDFSATGETDLPKGTEVGEYVIIDVLGRGGFGTVYRAVHPLIGKRVAIKLLSRKFSADSEMVSRFMAEARAVNQIRHRHIIDIFSFGKISDGRQYYVMEHLDGEPLDRYLAVNGPLKIDEALPILRAVARALDAAHAKGVAHRDLKPENIFLARDDEGGLFPKLLDFGIAKLSGQEEQLAHKTHTGVPIGTPYYMSPEQCRGKDVDHRTDIYSFGMLAYRLLTGCYPFEGALVDILHHQMYDEAAPPSSKNPALTAKIDAAIAWMIKKDPDERPQNLITAVLALDERGSTPMLTPTSMAGMISPVAPGTKLKSRRWIAPVVAIGLLGAAGGGYLAMNRQSNPPAGAVVEPQRIAVAGVVVDASMPDAASLTAGNAQAAEPPPPASTLVTVSVNGVPKNTEVLLAGSVIATAPGEVQLPRGGKPVVLTFRADGYAPLSKTIRPDKDQPLVLKLVPKRRGVQGKTHSSEDDDVIHVFGKEN